MTIKEYQHQAMKTCMDTCDNFSYMMLNLVGEVGEFASKVAKGIRKGDMYIGGDEDDTCSMCHLYGRDEDIHLVGEEDLKKEAGDILWQIFGLMSSMGWDADEIAQQNLDKLASRHKRNVIDGDGDNR